MKNLPNSSASVLAILCLLIFGIACSTLNQSQNNTAQVEVINPSPTPKADATKAEPTQPVTAAKDLSGDYKVSGTNPAGQNYQGDLTVTKRDSVYQFSWNAAGTYDGIGVQDGATAAVAYTTGKDGKGCGAAIYRIGADGSTLDGKFGEWGVNQSGTEKATRTGGTGLAGEYDITGKNTDGKDYKGKLSVKADGNVFQLTWDAGRTYSGTGIKQGDFLAVGSGPKQCGFVIYETKGSDLDGKWGVPGTNTLGTEKAVKK